MAWSLMFHIIFAVVGMAMPLLMVIAERRWHKTGDAVYLALAKRWAKGTGIMFAVGAVSGTVLSIELGLLWPDFMAFAGSVVGFPFALEGFAFFLEAIFLGIYLYGWERVSPRVHWWSGIMVGLCGTLSGIFVVTVNAWMNTPAGFTIVDGMPADIDIWAAMWNPASFAQTAHMTVAAYQALAFAVAAVHAWALLRSPGNRFHQAALGIALPVAFVTALAQPLIGDWSAKTVAKTQWIKLAAMEGQWETQKAAPLRLGGWPDEADEETRFDLEIPFLLSILAYGDPHAEVKGLKEAPAEERPPVAVVHFAFQAMILAGMMMAATALIGVFAWWRNGKRLPGSSRFLKLIVVNGPLGMLAIEAGWLVTEVGRQPWVIQGVMRTRDAVTPQQGLWFSLTVFVLVYLVLGLVVARLMKSQVFASLEEEA